MCVYILSDYINSNNLLVSLLTIKYKHKIDLEIRDPLKSSISSFKMIF